MESTKFSTKAYTYISIDEIEKAFNFYNGLFNNILYCLYNMMKLDKKKNNMFACATYHLCECV